jgi:threonine/homoserine/homoserine lactone efflux protein
MPIEQHLLVMFTLTTIVAMLAPGPDMLFVLGAAMRGGPRAGLLATAGVATSEAVHITVAAAGLTALFAAVPIAFTVVRVVGGAYLIYLGVQLIRHRNDEPSAVPDLDGRMSGRRAYLRGLLTNLLNQKMITFTIAFLPQFIDPALGRVWLQFAVLGAIMIVLEFLVDGTVGVLGGRIGGWLRRRRAARRRIDVATGGLFIGLGVRLAAER